MILLIAHHHDAEAQWLCDILQKKNKVACALLIPEALGIDYDVSLHLRNNGRHDTTIYFYHNNQVVNGSDVTYILNRLGYIHPIIWNNASPTEKTYATNEMNAFFAAFIHTFTCPVSNQIYHGALGAEVNFASKWTAYLKQHNIPIHPCALDHSRHATELLRGIPAENVLRCLKMGKKVIISPTKKKTPDVKLLSAILSRHTSKEMTEFIFLNTTGSLQLLAAHKTPALSVYGNKLVNILHTQTKISGYDPANRNTQRNSCAAIG